MTAQDLTQFGGHYFPEEEEVHYAKDTPAVST
jgi:hypothetical protein